jgi:hypothetical protein
VFDEGLGQLDGQLSDEDRVTIGQRLAGAIKQPSYMPARPVGTPDAGQPPADAPAPFDPNLLPESIRPKVLKPNEVPTPPSGVNNPNLVDLARQQAAKSTPINPVDPVTHKNKPQYDLGRAGRIIGTISNALGAFGASKTGQPFKPMDVSPSATNYRFGQEEAARQGELAGINEQIGTAEKLDTENERLFRDASRQAYEAQVGEARQGTAAAQKETADTKASLAQSQKDLNEARANKLDTPAEPKTEVELSLAYQNAIAKNDPKAKVYKGALDQLARQKAAGKDTSAADLAKTLQVENQRQREMDSLNKERDAERARRHEEFGKTKAGSMDFKGEKTAAFDAQLTQELDKKYADRTQQLNDRYDKMLGLTKAGPKLQTQKSAPQAPPKVGATVMVDGKPHKVIGYNEKTKKPIVSPQ